MAAGVRRAWVSRLLGALLFALGIALPHVSAAGEDAEVDLALVLAIDCSFSVDSHEFQLQMEGLGRAFLRPEVQKAIRAGDHQRIAVIAMQWSESTRQMVVVPWTVISSDAEAEVLGRVLAATPRELGEGGTSISKALLFGENLFASAPPATRRVIDLSSDGRNNSGPPVSPARDRLVAHGITINALPILNEFPTLDIYFDNQVVGGEGHFVLPTRDYQTYGEAIYRKLLREITGPGIS
jgi:hypothetical protein